MARILLPLVLLLPVTALAQGFEERDGVFVWRKDRQQIRFDKGRFTIGEEGGKQVGFYPFLWHDAWLYETLPGGTVTAGPTLQADGRVTMAGSFSARQDSAPVRYTLVLTPGAAGVQAHFTFEKSGELKLTSGIWLHLFADRKLFSGEERYWAHPAQGGRLTGLTQAMTDRLYLETRDGEAVTLAPGGLRGVNREDSPNAFVMRLNLVRGDFPRDQPVTADLALGFGTLPATFPGEIKPRQELLALRKVTPTAAKIGRYEKLELRVELGATYDNPYDPGDVALDAVFTAPSGRTVKVPGFFMVEQRRVVQDGAEVLLPEGNGEWRVRFAPTELGKYTWTLTLRDRTGTVTGGRGSFTSVAGASRGFLRQSQADPHYLAFDNGAGFFAIGHNLPGYHMSGQLGDQAMRRFAAAKENYNRWWLYSYNLGLEWTGKLGWYRQDSAWRLDFLCDLARELGLYYMLCLDTHQDFREKGWAKNPFNAANGGPCANAGEWFTNEQARALYKQRLRYLVARYAYSPHILCWEFGNEFEGWADSPDALKLPWHREMSDYLAALDPYRHLITTSFWGHTGPPEYWQLPNLDIVQTHLYTNDDTNVAESVRALSLKQWREFAKPHLFSEFGIRSHATTADKDPQGWGLHNALWAGLTSFCAGGPMPWWHENYIEPLNLYFHFTALANFTADLPLGTAKWEPLAATAEFQDKTRPPDTTDAVVVPVQRWGKPEAFAFTLQDDGSLAGEARPQALLHGLGHQDLATPVVFDVNYPKAGQFVMHVTRVSNSGLLRVWVDGQQVAEFDLPCGEGLGKDSTWREQWKLWETTYEQDYSVPVPAGPHQIRVENFGKDWVTVSSYRFTGCQVRRAPNLLVCGMKSPRVAVLWLQNRDSDWYNHGQGQVPAVDPTVVTLTGLAPGKWQGEWWETWQGTRSRTEMLTVSSRGELTLRLPALRTDVALKLRR